MVNIPSISNKRKKTKNNPELNILPELESFLRPFVFHPPFVYALFPRLLFLDGRLFRSLHIWSIIFLAAKINTIFEITKKNFKKIFFFYKKSS